MRYVALKAAGGGYLGMSEDGRLELGRRRLTPAEIFERKDEGGGRVIYRSVASGAEISIGDGDGPYDRQDLGALMAAALSQRCCCGLPDHHDGAEPAGAGAVVPANAEVQWGRKTHRQIVDNAFFLVGRHPDMEGAALLLDLWRLPAFREEVVRGLMDADRFNLIEYTGVLWAKHFYDPDTGTNYFGYKEGTALTEGIRHFDKSLEHLAEALPSVRAAWPLPEEITRQMGHRLGLALHYFTDLTQPMHASNFANVFASGTLHDWRHSGFEVYTEANRGRFVGDLTCVRREEIDPKALGFGGPRDVLQAVARNAKRIFVEKVEPEAAKKIQWGEWLDGVPMINSHWGEEADPALAEALPLGQKMTAAFLLYWATQLD